MDPKTGNARWTRSLKTLAVHAGEPRPGLQDAIATPIFQSSTYDLGEPEEFDDIRYIRLNNTPNHGVLAGKLAALEQTEDAVVTPSGTAAISMALTSHLSAGDHVLAQRDIYGGTRKILTDLGHRMGVSVSYVDMEDADAWQRALTRQTRIFYIESISNPLLAIAPLDQVVAFARDHGLVTMVDNTIATPVNFRPAALGIDLILHSASKYLNGHTDVVAGVVAGSTKRVHRVRKYMNLAGVCLAPHSCYLLQRGLKTLPLRMAAQNQAAGTLARALARMPQVARVRYPGLPDNAYHARARRWFHGFGGLVTVQARSERAARDLIARLRIAREAPSFGGVESLVCRPVDTSHAGLPSELLRTLDITPDMVRVSVGVEGIDDLVDDFAQALANLSTHAGHEDDHEVTPASLGETA